MTELEKEIENVPYFYARKAKKGYEIRGIPSCLLGHKLPTKQGKPDGIFAEWFWDGSQLLVRNDRYGFYPLYYFVRKDEIAVSASIPKLLAEGASAEFDEAGLAVFLRLGFFIGDDTPFKMIRAVPPNTSFEWQDGQLRVEGHLAICKQDHLSRSEIIDSYISLFRNAMQRRLPTTEQFAAPLSGGRDSRHILLELCELGYKPGFCATVRNYPPYRNEAEVAPAAAVAQALNIQHVVLNQTGSTLQSELRKNLKTNFGAIEHAWFMILAQYLRGKVHTFYDGIAGDVLSAGHFLDAERLAFYQTGNFTGLAEHLFDADVNAGESTLASILPIEQYRRFSRELGISHLTAEIEKHCHAPNPVGSFFLFNRTRRGVAITAYGILDTVPQVFSPFLDHDLYDFLASLPATILLDHQLHTETIARAYPRYAHIPFKEKNPAVGDSAYFRQFTREVARYALSGNATQFVRKSYLIPRLLRCLLDSDYSVVISWLGPLAIYLVQLEMVRGRYATHPTTL